MIGSAYIRVTRVIAPNDLAREVAPAVVRVRDNIIVRARRLVPKRSFRLHDSIRPDEVRIAGGKVGTGVLVGGQDIRGRAVDYWDYVERGTSRMAAQPFMRPAVLQTTDSDLTRDVVVSWD